MPDNAAPLPDFTRWPSFPFEGDMRIKALDEPVPVEPPRHGEDGTDCVSCATPDEAYIWVSERWRVRAMDRPTGLPMVLILESRSHLDLGDLPNLLAAELGVMTVRLERAVRSLDGVARVHVNRWGDGSAHLHLWFLARPYGRLQLRGTFLSLWDDILPDIPENQWRENLALVAAWLAEFGGRPLAEPPHIAWQSPSTIDTSGAEIEAVAFPRGRVADEVDADADVDATGDAGDCPTQPSADQQDRENVPSGRSTLGTMNEEAAADQATGQAATGQAATGQAATGQAATGDQAAHAARGDTGTGRTPQHEPADVDTEARPVGGPSQHLPRGQDHEVGSQHDEGAIASDAGGGTVGGDRPRPPAGNPAAGSGRPATEPSDGNPPVTENPGEPADTAFVPGQSARQQAAVSSPNVTDAEIATVEIAGERFSAKRAEGPRADGPPGERTTVALSDRTQAPVTDGAIHEPSAATDADDPGDPGDEPSPDPPVEDRSGSRDAAGAADTGSRTTVDLRGKLRRSSPTAP